MVNQEKEKAKKIESRGIPSKFSFYLPPHYSKEIRSFQNEGETPTRNIWSLEEVLNFVFPKQYQPTYYNIALSFLKLLEEEGVIRGEETSLFLRENSISKATFYNRVLPKLKRVGIVKIERGISEKGKKDKKMKITISKTFGNYLMKIADSWLAFVDDVRTKRRKND